MYGEKSEESQARDKADGNEPAKPGLNVKSGQRYLGGACIAVAAASAAAIVYLRGPKTASASQPAPAELVAFNDDFVGHSRSARSADDAAGNPDKLIAELQFSAARVQVPLMELKGNPFRQGQDAALPAADQEDVATRDLREQQRQAALAAVQSLRLESIIQRGTSRACTINNVRYQEGQEADGFLVEEIASNVVVVRKGEYRFELKPSL